jgi:hypothetical protein
MCQMYKEWVKTKWKCINCRLNDRLFICKVEGRINIYCSRCSMYPDLLGQKGLVRSDTVKCILDEQEENERKKLKKAKKRS